MTSPVQSAAAEATAPAPPRQLILASSSPFRRSLLARLGLDFECFSPAVDETAKAGESGCDLSLRLALAKARAGRTRFAKALIIGSDQVATLAGKRLGKPGSRDKAFNQLRNASGKELIFYTGLCLLDAQSGAVQQSIDICRVRLRRLSESQIARYLEREQPFNCAASLKSEALGISLLEQMQTNDPTGLIGLPLISLVSMLQQAGFEIP